MKTRITSKAVYDQWYRESVDDPGKFWSSQAESFEWYQRWHNVVEADMVQGHNRWYAGGQLNITVNCLDRHLEDGGDQIALRWEPNEPDQPCRTLTYQALTDEVCRCANGLKTLGVRKGDRICLYMPMLPELVIAVLACARIGAIHSVVFAGFSAASLAERIRDASCTLVLCADFGLRGAKKIPVKSIVDEALASGHTDVKQVIVYKHTGDTIPWTEGRDQWWDELVANQSTICHPEVMDSEDPLFILYTSGSTGKPKGVVHTCGGYMVYAGYSFANVFQYRSKEIFWCTADVGWITGHTYLIYGPLLNKATALMFEGVPTYPDASRFWQVCEKHSVNIFYTAPTAIRSLMAAGDDYVHGHDLSALRILGSVGEPINEEAWHWYHEKVGGSRCPVIDTWWQTETGGILITPLPDITDTKPCHASYPLPGIQPVLLDAQGAEIQGNDVEGLLCIRYPWPSIIRTTWADHERCRQAYFTAFPGFYFTGDGARRDEEGRYRIIGRVDDVINVSGHRLGTAEIENALNEHDNVIESAVVGYPHPIKGQGIFAFLIVLHPPEEATAFKKEINDLLSHLIGPIARADEILIVNGLPKTRSGKIMRRLLRKIAEKDTDQLGDTSSLLNPEILDQIIQQTNPPH